MKPRRWKLIAACLLAMSAGILTATWENGLPWLRQAPPEVQGFFWPEQKALVPFKMVDHRHDPFTLEDLEGQWTLMFFGYTYCPDICPVTMSVLREAVASYHDRAPESLSDMKVAFVSVDGERDTPDHLAAYIRFYDESWIAASGDRDQVDSLTVQLGVPYEIDEHEPGALNYLVSHPGTLFLVSPDTKLAALLQPPLNAEGLADDLIEIRRFMARG